MHQFSDRMFRVQEGTDIARDGASKSEIQAVRFKNVFAAPSLTCGVDVSIQWKNVEKYSHHVSLMLWSIDFLPVACLSFSMDE
jgi:hypothetical protein